MGSNIKISVIATGFDERQLGYASANRPMFGAFSRDSKKRLGLNQPISEPTQPGVTKFDRAPGSFTQPQTVSQIMTPRPDDKVNPFVKSQAFGDQFSNPNPNPATNTTQSTAQTDDDDDAAKKDTSSDFEDEFEIPAFLRQGK